MTLEDKVENTFDLIDMMPALEVLKRMESTPPNRKLNLNKKLIETVLTDKLRSYKFPIDPRLMADCLYSLEGIGINFDSLDVPISDMEEANTYLKCLGNLRKNRVLNQKPDIRFTGKYSDYMFGKRVSDEEIDRLRKSIVKCKAAIKEIMELSFLGSIIY